MNQFSRGQKGKLADLGCGNTFSVEVDIQAPGMSVDVSCFGLDAADKLSDERYMVFYNQLASPEGAVQLAVAGSSSRFSVNLDALPPTIAKLVFVAAIDGVQTARALGACALNLGSAARFPWSGADFGDEKAVIVAELYRRDGTWRFGAVGQGFNGGLAALLAHFGGTEAGAAQAKSAPAAPTPAAPAAPAPAPVQPRVSLSKVTLEKRGDKVSLEKRSGKGFGRIHVNLNWNQSVQAPPPQPVKTGFFDKLIAGATSRKGRGGIDLDLGCMYELADGRKGLVQALGNAWGDLEREPFIRLDADDRTGAVAGGENLYINGERFDQIRRALIFSFIYEGVPNWAATDALVTIAAPEQAPIEVRLDGGGSQMMCAIALIENRSGSLQVTKLAEYFQQEKGTSAHELMDQRFGFGLRWKTGSKG